MYRSPPLPNFDRRRMEQDLDTALHWDPRAPPGPPPPPLRALSPLKVFQSLFRWACPSSLSDSDEITVRVKQNWTCCLPALHGLRGCAQDQDRDRHQDQDQLRGPAALEHQEGRGAPGRAEPLPRFGTYFDTFFFKPRNEQDLRTDIHILSTFNGLRKKNLNQNTFNRKYISLLSSLSSKRALQSGLEVHEHTFCCWSCDKLFSQNYWIELDFNAVSTPTRMR